MDYKKKKSTLTTIITIATLILVTVGSTFAYFSASISSNENAVSMGAATYSIDLIDDISLIKANLIPSKEEYVDISSTRVDENGDFLKPSEDEFGRKITEGTACIDDNLNEICSIYTFTVQNPMTDMELPLYITIHTAMNTFSNLYFKVLDEDKNIVMDATKLVDDRPYELGSDGNKIYNKDAKISPVALDINKVLPKAIDADTPSEVTYSIVLWIMETGFDQTIEDSSKVFGAKIVVSAGGGENQGITGIFSSGGVDKY